jgi:DNA-binding Xre family transcriptional regulator
MLKLNVSRVLLHKGVGESCQFLKRLGYKSAKASRMVRGQVAFISLYDMENLCLELNCTPNDLLDWHPNGPAHVVANHALQAICRKDDSAGIMAMVQGLPLEKIEEIEKLIAENVGEKSAKR